MEHYKLENLVHNRHVYVEVRKGMYGLKQASKLANNQLTAFLEPHGYRPVANTPGLWKHDTRPVMFTLVVDDFGVQYVDKDDFDHLTSALQQKYTISIDMTGEKYCGLTLQWDYNKRTCDVSIPGYIEHALQHFEHHQEMALATQLQAFQA
jgi:Reverse transcriptase (RNA-dependent DNA polymerase)